MPINEYDMTDAENGGTDVVVEIRSAQSDMTGTGLFAQTPKLGDDGASDNVYTLRGDGRLMLHPDGRTELVYDESELTDMAGCCTSVSFHRKKPGCVTITRSGSVSSSFVVEEKVRQMSAYKTPYGVFEMCVLAKKVRNCLDCDGGKIELDYVVELKGLTAQHTKMTIKVNTAKG